MNRQEAMIFNFLMALVIFNQTKKALKKGKTEKAKKLIELGKMYSLLTVAG
jgi:hypothetical protein